MKTHRRRGRRPVTPFTPLARVIADAAGALRRRDFDLAGKCLEEASIMIDELEPRPWLKREER
jgi:hypothetical protein